MADEIEIGGGFAKVPAGEWLGGAAQPVAAFGRTTVRGLKGFIVPDRGAVTAVSLAGDGQEGPAGLFSAADRPFLTRLDALPDEPLVLVSDRLRVAPAAARTGARRVRPIPMSLRASFAATEFLKGWAVAATKSRVLRVEVAEGRSLSVRPEALVAWTGRNPVGSCRRLGLLDLVLPRLPKGFALDFHGPAVVWLEGGERPSRAMRGFRNTGA